MALAVLWVTNSYGRSVDSFNAEKMENRFLPLYNPWFLLRSRPKDEIWEVFSDPASAKAVVNNCNGPVYVVILVDSWSTFKWHNFTDLPEFFFVGFVAVTVKTDRHLIRLANRRVAKLRLHLAHAWREREATPLFLRGRGSVPSLMPGRVQRPLSWPTQRTISNGLQSISVHFIRSQVALCLKYLSCSMLSSRP